MGYDSFRKKKVIPCIILGYLVRYTWVLFAFVYRFDINQKGSFKFVVIFSNASIVFWILSFFVLSINAWRKKEDEEEETLKFKIIKTIAAFFYCPFEILFLLEQPREKIIWFNW
jgi:hypothetical protein